MAAALVASGMPYDEVAAEVGTNASTLWRWRQAPWWAHEAALARGRLVRESDELEALVRHLALSDAAKVLRAGTADAAFIRAALASTQKSGEERTATVVRDLVASMPPALRERVLAWQNGEADLESLTDAELLARGGVKP